MANKLTKEKIDLLIEQVLSEAIIKIVYKGDEDDPTPHARQKKDTVGKDLIGTDGNLTIKSNPARSGLRTAATFHGERNILDINDLKSTSGRRVSNVNKGIYALFKKIINNPELKGKYGDEVYNLLKFYLGNRFPLHDYTHASKPYELLKTIIDFMKKIKNKNQTFTDTKAIINDYMDWDGTKAEAENQIFSYLNDQNFNFIGMPKLNAWQIRKVGNAAQFDAKSPKEKIITIKLYKNLLTTGILRDPNQELEEKFKEFISKMGLPADVNSPNDVNSSNLPFLHSNEKLSNFTSPEQVVDLAKLKEAVINEDENKLEIDDFTAAIEDPESPLHGPTVDFIKNLNIDIQRKRIPDLNDTLKGVVSGLLTRIEKQKSADAEKNIGADSPVPQVPVKGTYATSYGSKTPPFLIRAFETIAGTDDLASRMQNLKNLPNKIKNKNLGSMEEAICGSYVLNYLREILTSYESSAGGYLFENFLALLFSGTKEGLNVQIEDFTFGELGSSMGSAKLYRENATEFKGSIKNTKILVERGIDKIVYIVAIKSKDISSVKVYVAEIGVSVDDNDNLILSIDNTKVNEEQPTDNQWKIKMSSISGVPSYEIDLLGSVQNPRTFNDAVEGALEEAQAGVAKMFKNLNSFNVNITDYLSDQKKGEMGTINKAEEALQNFYELRKTSFQVLAATDKSLSAKQAEMAPYAKGYPTPPGYDPGSITKQAKQKVKGEISETKSLKELDKLIERVILNKMNKL